MRSIGKRINDDIRAFSINEFCAAYSVGRSFAYDEIKEGHLIAKKPGSGRGRTLIGREDAERWLADAPAISPRNRGKPEPKRNSR